MVKTDRKVDWQKFTLALLIAVFLFSFGVFIGYIAKQVSTSATIDIQDNIRNQIIELETIDLMEKGSNCESLSLDILSEKLDYLGQLISMLEIKNGKSDGTVLELKKLYTSLEIRHMLLIKDKSKNCNVNNTVFLFFYSNDKLCKDSVDKTSFILSYLRNKYDYVKVYSFDNDLKSDIITLLKKKYSISSCSSVVVDDNLIDKNITSSDELEYLFSK